MELDPMYFNAEHDRCYCPVCAAAVSMPDVLEHGKAHGCPYEVPKGWCGFGLDVPKRAFTKDLAVFEKWAMSFHGCPSDLIPSILKQGDLLMPGDKMIDGKELPNRLTRGGSDRIGLYTSPSIKYAELDIYSKPAQWSGSSVRTVMQCRQSPETWEVKGETIGWQRRFGEARFSQHFSNEEIERFTKARGCIIPYRVLVGIDVKTREEELEELEAVAMAATKAADDVAKAAEEKAQTLADAAKAAEDVAKAADDAAAAANAAWAALEAATGSPVPPAGKARGGFLERLRGWAGLVPQAMVCASVLLDSPFLLCCSPPFFICRLFLCAVSAVFCVAAFQPRLCVSVGDVWFVSVEEERERGKEGLSVCTHTCARTYTQTHTHTHTHTHTQRNTFTHTRLERTLTGTRNTRSRRRKRGTTGAGERESGRRRLRSLSACRC